MTDLLPRFVDAARPGPGGVVVLVAAVLAGGRVGPGGGLRGPRARCRSSWRPGCSSDRDAWALLWAVVTLSAAAGDSLGWLLGRRVGPPLRRGKAVQRMGAEGWDRASGLVRRHGAWAVVVARFLPVVRAMVPPVAGASGMPYRVFAPASLAGAAVQSAVLVVAGTLAGEAVVTAWPQVQDRLGTVAVVVLGAAVIGVGLVLPRDGWRREGAEAAAVGPSGLGGRRRAGGAGGRGLTATVRSWPRAIPRLSRAARSSPGAAPSLRSEALPQAGGPGGRSVDRGGERLGEPTTRTCGRPG